MTPRRSSASHPDRYKTVALVLQGGGALGAYQLGAFEALTVKGYQPDWLAGISIGSINAAIICGNPPQCRLEQLRKFWRKASVLLPPADFEEKAFNKGIKLFQAMACSMLGIPGLVRPRLPIEHFFTMFSGEIPSLYDNEPLRQTLIELVDFDYINHSDVRLSLGAVNVTSGKQVFFDNTQVIITPEHVLASAALPPYFPPVAIDGHYYWDGGIISNTPLHWVLHEESGPKKDMLVFQIDLWNKKGQLPVDLLDAEERRKDIVYSSRCHINIDCFRREQQLRNDILTLSEKLPESEREKPEIKKILLAAQEPATVRIVLLTYSHQNYNTMFKDYAFSQSSLHKHKENGLNDMKKILNQRDWLQMPENINDISIDIID